MPTEVKCPFYRSHQSLTMGRGLGYCDLDSDQAICEGDVQFCKDRETLKKKLLELKHEESSNDKEKSEPGKPFKFNILVVDDEEPMRKLMLTLLSRLGHQCVTASNGIEALNQINQKRFDAVITDIVMPEMDGIVLAKEILILYPNLPIMVMTGHGKQYSAESAIAAGAGDFIEKPFSIDEFVLRLNKMIRDSEIRCQMETKQNEMKTKQNEMETKQNDMAFQLSRRSSEEINDLKREIESLKSRLSSVYSRSW